MTARDECPAGVLWERRSQGCAVLRFVGELDAASAPEAQDQIEEYLSADVLPQLNRLIIDLTGLSFLDSSGIRLLVQVLHRKGEQTELVLVLPRATGARRAVEIVGLERVMRVVEQLDEALCH